MVKFCVDVMEAALSLSLVVVSLAPEATCARSTHVATRIREGALAAARGEATWEDGGAEQVHSPGDAATFLRTAEEGISRCLLVARCLLGHPYMATGPMKRRRRAPNTFTCDFHYITQRDPRTARWIFQPGNHLPTTNSDVYWFL